MHIIRLIASINSDYRLYLCKWLSITIKVCKNCNCCCPFLCIIIPLSLSLLFNLICFGTILVIILLTMNFNFYWQLPVSFSFIFNCTALAHVRLIGISFFPHHFQFYCITHYSFIHEANIMRCDSLRKSENWACKMSHFECYVWKYLVSLKEEKRIWK